MCMSSLSISPSPFPCFIRRLCCSRTVTSTPRARPHRLRRALPEPRSAGRSLATWPIPRTPQVMSPRSSTRPLLWTVTRRPLTIRTTIASVTSRKPHARTLDCSVFPQCLKPLFRTFLMVMLLFRENQESMPRETVARQREGAEREGSVISVTESMSKKSRRNSARSHSLRTYRGFYSDERDLRQHLERRAQQDIVGENSVQRKYTQLSTTWRF